MKLMKSILLSSLLVASLGSYAGTISKTVDLEKTITSVELTEITPSLLLVDNLDMAKGQNPNQDPNATGSDESIPTDPQANNQSGNGGAFSVNGAGQLEQANQSLGTIVEITDRLIAIGQKVWKIIESGKPVQNIDGVIPSVSVLPRGLQDSGSLYDMFGWSEPVVKKFNLDYKNAMGATVITLRFSVQMQYAGTDGNGGVYLSGVSIVPDQVKVAWGWDFNAQTRLINITNRGTAQNPIAAATLELAYQVKNAKVNESKRLRFFVDANGKIAQLQ